MSLAKWRIPFMILVYVGFFAHTALWHSFGHRTVGHLGFGEFFGTLQNGIVTAGTVFSLMVLVHALLFGGMFCGWLCHWGILQDAIAGVLRRLGFELRPVRIWSRWVPWLWFSVMLGQVAFYWLARGLPGGFTWLVGNTPVWSGVPRSILMIFLTTIISGFVLILMFGERAFCRTVCPFRLWFSWSEAIAPYQIRQAADCTACQRECNAACPMVIDVAGEVQAHGEVRNHECVKCLECIDACPPRVLRGSFTRLRPANAGATYQSPANDVDHGEVFFASVISALMVVTLCPTIGGFNSMSAGFALGFAFLRLRQTGTFSWFEGLIVPLLALALFYRADLDDTTSTVKGLLVLAAFLLITRLVGYRPWNAYLAARQRVGAPRWLTVPLVLVVLGIGGREAMRAWYEAQIEAAQARNDWVALGCMLDGYQEIAPDRIEALINLARARKKAGQLGSAAAAIAMAEQIASTPELVAELVDIRRRQGETTAARELLAAGIARFDRSPLLHLLKADEEFQGNRVHDAERTARAGLAVDPWHPELRLLLAMILEQQGRGLEAAVEYAQVAANAPKVGAKPYARFLIGGGRFAEADAPLRAAIEADPRDATLQFDLGVVAAELGRLTEAAEAWEAAARLDPTLTEARDNAARARQRLAGEPGSAGTGQPTNQTGTASIGISP